MRNRGERSLGEEEGEQLVVDELRLVFDGEADQDGLLVGEDVDTLSAGAYAGEHLGGAVVVEEASGGAELDVGMETGFWSPR